MLAPFGWGPPLSLLLERKGDFSSIEGSQRVSHSSPIRLVNPLLFFLLSSSSLPILYLTGATHSINKKKKVAIQLKMV